MYHRSTAATPSPGAIINTGVPIKTQTRESETAQLQRKCFAERMF
jgi:hypothetical protein